MPNLSALILALGFIIGSAIISFGLLIHGKYVFQAGRAAQPHHQIDLRIPDHEIELKMPEQRIDLKIRGDNFSNPVNILDSSKK